MGLLANRGKDTYWVAISYVGDGPQEGPVQWVISVICDPGFNLLKRWFHKPDGQALTQLRESVRQAVMSNPAIRIVNPLVY